MVKGTCNVFSRWSRSSRRGLACAEVAGRDKELLTSEAQFGRVEFNRHDVVLMEEDGESEVPKVKDERSETKCAGSEVDGGHGRVVQ